MFTKGKVSLVAASKTNPLTFVFWALAEKSNKMDNMKIRIFKLIFSFAFYSFSH